MLLSAAHRNVILLPLVFLIGVWVGQSRLIDQQSDGQDNPRGAEIQSELEQRTPFTGGGEVLAKSEDNCIDHFGNKLGNASPTAQKNASGTAESVSAKSDLDNSAVIDEQEGDVSQQQLTGIASGLDPSWENDDSEPTQEFSDMTDVLAPPDESWSESYSFLEGIALEGSAIEPSPQSIEEDIIRSLEEAGISPEEIPNRVENVMGMILQEDQQTPEAYPSISAP
jgi:hypothetical protein